MNPSSLHALIIDRHFGELSPEAAELLDLHLAQNTAARAESDRILTTLGVTRDAMLQHPELARVPPQLKTVSPALASAPAGARTLFSPWLARAAAIVLLGSLIATGGFMAGRSSVPSISAPSTVAVAASPALSPAQRKASPWARYRMTFDASGSGMQVVRVDVPSPHKNSIQ